MSLLIDENTTIRLILALTSLQIILSSCESLYDNRIYAAAGLLSWKYIQQSKKIFRETPLITRMFNSLFSYPNVLFLITLRLLFAITTLWAVWINTDHRLLVALILVVTVLGILLTWRNTYSNNGADQMAIVVLIAISISTLENKGGVIKTLSIIFIACQSQLSYLTSGFFKLLEKDWRSGASLKGIFSTEVFGNQIVKCLMDGWSPSYKIISAFVIYGELALGGCIFFPPKISIVLLCAGMLFHLATAFVMGLNGFFWSFVATYPAVYFLSLRFHA